MTDHEKFSQPDRRRVIIAEPEPDLDEAGDLVYSTIGQLRYWPIDDVVAHLEQFPHLKKFVTIVTE